MTKKLKYDDEFEYQNLMDENEWNAFEKVLNEDNMRYLWIDKTNWYNLLTKKKSTVHNMLIMATEDNSNRTIAVNKIILYNKTGNEEKTWTINEEYAHVNLNRDSSNYFYVPRNIKPGQARYKIYYQAICCPITQHHMYQKDKAELALIFKGQIMGQNTNSPFQRIHSVKNNYVDEAITVSDGFLKNTAPVLQLITRQPLYNLQNIENAREYLASVQIPKDDSEVMVKLRQRSSYSTVSREEAEGIYAKEISNYYPMITYEQTQHIVDSIPKVEMDFTCIGLGSAGTGILDQVGRSTWFKNYLLIDMDKVEFKNLRNQWYYKEVINNTKDYASKHILQSCTNVTGGLHIINKYAKFQDVGLSAYKSKYVVSGFDSIECRLELLDKVESKEFEVQYLIDARYDELTSSVYFIDVNDDKQMKYYRKGLESDLEAFKEMERKEEESRQVKTVDQFLKYLDERGVFSYACSDMREQLGINKKCEMNTSITACGGDKCKEYWISVWDRIKDTSHGFVLNKPVQESSCVRQNFIDIYKFSSSFVFAAIREIEAGNPKPFTHVEATTEGVPHAMTLRG